MPRPRRFSCPFTGETLAALPALYPDVAAIHVHEADRYGNCRIRGTTVADLDLARAAKRLIITCERLDPARGDPPRPEPHRHPVLLRRCRLRGALRQLPRQHAVRVLLRRGPPASSGWRSSAISKRSRRSWTGTSYGVRDFGEYLQLCGGLPRMQELRRQEFLLHQGR